MPEFLCPRCGWDGWEGWEGTDTTPPSYCPRCYSLLYSNEVPAQFRAGGFEGALIITKGGESIELTQAEVKRLLAFLEPEKGAGR